jgi:hypothetical protein
MGIIFIRVACKIAADEAVFEILVGYGIGEAVKVVCQVIYPEVCEHRVQQCFTCGIRFGCQDLRVMLAVHQFLPVIFHDDDCGDGEGKEEKPHYQFGGYYPACQEVEVIIIEKEDEEQHPCKDVQLKATSQFADIEAQHKQAEYGNTKV